MRNAWLNLQKWEPAGWERVSPWNSALVSLGVVFATLLYLYWSTAISMASIWLRSDTFAHGMFVPPCVGWLVWRQRGRLRGLTPQPAIWVAILFIGGSMTWLVGDLAVANSVTQIAFVALIVLSVPLVLGWSVARVIAFPLAYLFFAVPVGDFLLHPLMEWTADFTVLALRVSGVPVYREGLNFVIPSGSWSVVEACSGVRYLIASLAVGALFAHLNYQSAKRQWLFIIVSAIVPILANWVRAYMIVLLGHLSSNRLATGVDHLIYGWLFFGIIISLMFTIGVRWSDAEEPLDTAPLPTPPRQSGRFGSLIVAVVAAGIISSFPPFWRAFSERHEVGERQVHLVAPQTLGSGWELDPTATTRWVSATSQPDAELNAVYRSNQQSVGVYVGYFRRQTYDRKAAGYMDGSLVGTGDVWRQISESRTATDDSEGQADWTVVALRPGRTPESEGNKEVVAWHAYWAGGRFTASATKARIYAAWAKLRGLRDDTASVVLYSVSGSGTAAENISEFAKRNHSALESALGAVPLEIKGANAQDNAPP